MVNVCCAPGCTNKSTRDISVSYHRFPANKKLQRKWLQSLWKLIRAQGLAVITLRMEKNRPGLMYPSLVPQPMQPRKPVTRLCGNDDNTIDSLENEIPRDESAYSMNQVDYPEEPLAGDYADKVTNLDENLYSVYPNTENNDDEYMPIPVQPMRLEHIYGNDKRIRLYTGLQKSTTFHILCDNLGVPINNLQYWGRPRTFPDGNKRGPARKLKPHNELLLTLMELRFGLAGGRFSFSIWNLPVISVTDN